MVCGNACFPSIFLFSFRHNANRRSRPLLLVPPPFALDPSDSAKESKERKREDA